MVVELESSLSCSKTAVRKDKLVMLALTFSETCHRNEKLPDDGENFCLERDPGKE